MMSDDQLVAHMETHHPEVPDKHNAVGTVARYLRGVHADDHAMGDADHDHAPRARLYRADRDDPLPWTLIPEPAPTQGVLRVWDYESFDEAIANVPEYLHMLGTRGPIHNYNPEESS